MRRISGCGAGMRAPMASSMQAASEPRAVHASRKPRRMPPLPMVATRLGTRSGLGGGGVVRGGDGPAGHGEAASSRGESCCASAPASSAARVDSLLYLQENTTIISKKLDK